MLSAVRGGKLRNIEIVEGVGQRGHPCFQCGSRDTLTTYHDHDPATGRLVRIYPRVGETSKGRYVSIRQLSPAAIVPGLLLMLDIALGYFEAVHFAIALLLCSGLLYLIPRLTGRPMPRYHEAFTCRACGCELICA